MGLFLYQIKITRNSNLMPYITKVVKGELPKLHVSGGDYPTLDGTGYTGLYSCNGFGRRACGST